VSNVRTEFMDDEMAVRKARSRRLIVVRPPAIYIAAREYGWIEVGRLAAPAMLRAS
jgi:hypothetical protein